MAESTGIGQELGIMGKFRKVVGLGPKPAQTLPPPKPGEVPQVDVARMAQEGKFGSSGRSPATDSLDRRVLGETPQPAPVIVKDAAGNIIPNPKPEPTYIAQGTELDNQPLASSQAEPAAPETSPETPSNVVPFPTKAEPMEKPAA